MIKSDKDYRGRKFERVHVALIMDVIDIFMVTDSPVAIEDQQYRVYGLLLGSVRFDRPDRKEETPSHH